MPKCNFNKVVNNFIEITLQYGCSLINFLYSFRILFLKNTSGRLLLNFLKHPRLLFDLFNLFQPGVVFHIDNSLDLQYN